MVDYDMNYLLTIMVVKHFTYLGIAFTPSCSFSEVQQILALKAIFKMNKYSYKFREIYVQHSLFDKLVPPVLNYDCEVWGFIKGTAIEKVHMQFCKRMLGVKKTT